MRIAAVESLGVPIALAASVNPDTFVYNNTLDVGSGAYTVGAGTANPGPGPSGSAVAVYYQSPESDYQSAYPCNLLLQDNSYLGYSGANSSRYYADSSLPPSIVTPSLSVIYLSADWSDRPCDIDA